MLLFQRVRPALLSAALSAALFAALSMPALPAFGAAGSSAPLGLAPLTSEVGGGDIHPLPGLKHTWLSASPRSLSLLSDDAATALIRGSFESIDARHPVQIDGQARVLVSAIDVEAGAIRLFSIDPERLTLRELADLTYPEAIPDAQCLFVDPDDGDISVFSIDALGIIEQRYVYDAASQRPVDLSVRRFIGVPDPQACAVDDAMKALYVAEESVGVWRYRADVENDPARDPILLRTPFGELAGEATDLAVDHTGAVWLLDAASQRVYRSVPDTGVTTHWPLGDDSIAADALAIAVEGSTAVLAIYDENADKNLTGSLPAGGEAASRTRPQPIPALLPVAQTAAVARFGDAADDPAIYVNRVDTARSLILGTDIREGLGVYSLNGSLPQFLAVGRLNPE